jgi:hypothetical protein
VSSGSSSEFSEAFLVEKVDGVGDRGSSDTTKIDTDTLAGLVEKCPLRSNCFTEEAKKLSSSARISGFLNYLLLN